MLNDTRHESGELLPKAFPNHMFVAYAQNKNGNENFFSAEKVFVEKFVV